MKSGYLNLCVEVGGKGLEEYEIATNERETTCWIASEEGKEFVIHGANSFPGQAISCTVTVDGRRAESMLYRTDKPNSVRGVPTGDDTVLPFVFSGLQVSDDDALRNQMNPGNIEALGTIRLTFRRAKELGISTRTDSARYERPEEFGRVHERTKKAGAHCVSFGKERKVASSSRITVEYLDTMEEPYHVFVFRYRPEAMLRAQGINVVSSSAAPSANNNLAPSGENANEGGSQSNKRTLYIDVKQDSDDSEDEGQADLQAQLDAAAAQLESLRAKMSKKKSRKRVKREISPIRLESGGDVIDLTSD